MQGDKKYFHMRAAGQRNWQHRHTLCFIVYPVSVFPIKTNIFLLRLPKMPQVFSVTPPKPSSLILRQCFVVKQ